MWLFTGQPISASCRLKEEPMAENSPYAADGDMNADEAEQVFKKKPTRRRALITAAALITVLILGVVPVTYSYLMASSETVVNTFAGGAVLIADASTVTLSGGSITGNNASSGNNAYIDSGCTLTDSSSILTDYYNGNSTSTD